VDVTPLECLSLQRVAEEALTNIVKHSHATVVQIRIYYENTALVMEVEDNGVGFDVDLVNQAGLSVGLRSYEWVFRTDERRYAKHFSCGSDDFKSD